MMQIRNKHIFHCRDINDSDRKRVPDTKKGSIIVLLRVVKEINYYDELREDKRNFQPGKRMLCVKQPNGYAVL